MDFSLTSTCKSGSCKKRTNFHRHNFHRALAFFVAAVLCLSVLSGCGSASDNAFPKVTQPTATDTASTDTASVTSSASAENPSETTVLKVAAPISNTTAQYLAKLYAAKKSGKWNDQENGTTVSLEWLNEIKPSFSVDIIQTPSTGATQDTIKQWEENGFAPDIMYTDALADLSESGDILPLTNYAASNSLFLPTRLYLPMLDACSIRNELYGIPYSAAAEILYVNLNVLSAAGINSVPFDLDLDTLKTMSEAVRNMSPADTPLEQQSFAFYKAGDLIPFLPSSFSGTAGWFMFNGLDFDFTAGGFSSAMNYLRAYVKAGYSVDSLTAEDQRTAFTSLDPRLSSRVAMWSGSSAEVTRWSINQAFKLSLAQIPAETADKKSRLALTVYPLCISSKSQSPQLACDFASFIALDEDAILLSTRLETLDGLLPVVSSSAVWEAVCLPQTFGGELLLLQDKVPDAYYNPVTNHRLEYLLTQQLLNEYRSSLLDDTVDLQMLISSLSNTKLTS